MKNLLVLLIVLLATSAFAADPFSFRGILFGKSLEEQKLPNECFQKAYSPNGYSEYNVVKLPDIGIHFHLSYSRLVDEKIEYYAGVYDEYNTDKLLDMMRKKYGKPKMKKGKKRNRMGAIFPFIEARWKLKGYNIRMNSISYQVDRGSLYIESDKYIKYDIKKGKETDRKADVNDRFYRDKP